MLRNSIRRPPLPGLSAIDLKRYTYVDKTHLLARILSDDPHHSPGQFLHAPAMRRIGKSTTIRFLAEMAKCEKKNRDYFDGLAVNESDSPFSIGDAPLAVIQLDFSGSVHSKMELASVEGVLTRKLCREAYEQHQIHISSSLIYPSEVFSAWIGKLRAKEGKPIVLLIDEYDAPVSAFFPESPEKAHEVAMMLKPFYETIKSRGDYFHKVFVTGVSKFSSTSMFSGPNQFVPLMEESAEFSALYGFTESEIRNTYGRFIEMEFDAPLDEIIGNMKRMYNGYRIHPLQKDSDLLYNSWSVLKYIQRKCLSGYWAKSAASASVMSMLGLRSMNILKGFEITQERLFANISAKEYNTCWQQMAFQSGYASILSSHFSDASFEAEKTHLQLGPPNQEVKRYLESGMVEYIGNIVNPNLLTKYRRNLFRFDFQNASKYLRDLIVQQSRLPSNEAEFAAFAVYSLQVHNVAPHVLDIAFESGIKLDNESASAGKYPTFDCAVLYRSDEGSVCLLVLELKFNHSRGSGVKQILDKKYVARARKILEERNNVVINVECAVSLNLVISQDKVHIEVEHV